MKAVLLELKRKYTPDFIIVNGENSAGGRGITEQIAKELFEQGIHGITMGNHTWDNKDVFNFIDKETRLIRPANFPPGTPGVGFTVVKNQAGKELALINLQGRTFLPPLDCPFQAADAIVDKLKKKTKYIFVDFHAEATSEKIAMGWHLDGKVSAVVGTHTHVQTHDERVLPAGTAYVTDVGMTGARDGVLGMERESVLYRFKSQLPSRFTADEGKWQLHAVSVELDSESGLAKRIELIRRFESEVIFE